MGTHANKMNTVERFNAPSPPFFIKLQKIAMSALFIAPVIGESLVQLFPDNADAAALITRIVTYATVLAGGIIKVIAKLTVDETKIKANGKPRN